MLYDKYFKLLVFWCCLDVFYAQVLCEMYYFKCEIATFT